MFPLTRNELACLAPFFPQTNPLGLFASHANVVLGTETQSLTEKGVLVNGSVAPLAAGLLITAANPDVVARVALFNGPLSLEKIVYRQGPNLALLEMTERSLQLSAPRGWDDAVSEYAQFLGGSASHSTSLDLDLDPMQATAFFALFDIERTRVLNALLGHSDDSVGASTKAVAAAVVNPLDGGLVCLLTESELPSSINTEAALASLAAAGVLESENGTYLLSEEALTLARRFVVVQTGITLDLLQPTPQGIANATTFVLSASPLDALTVCLTGDRVQIVALSAASILTMLEQTMSCPSIVAG